MKIVLGRGLIAAIVATLLSASYPIMEALTGSTFAATSLSLAVACFAIWAAFDRFE